MKLKLVTSLSTVALLTAGIQAPASAQQRTVTLRVADPYPAGHHIITYGVTPWFEDITKRTGGSIKIEYYPSQQLGKAKDLLSLANTGVADIIGIGPSYVGDKMPLSEVATLPANFRTPCEGTAAYRVIATNGVAAADFTSNKMRLLWGVVMAPYQIFSARQPINSAADVKGLKLRSNGGAMDIMATTLGAVPVRMAAQDTYQALSQRTLDGLIFPTTSIPSYDLTSLIKHATLGANLGNFVGVYAISERGWAKLDAAQQKALMEASDHMFSTYCKDLLTYENQVIDKLKAAGVNFNELSEETLKEFAAASRVASDSWAEALARRGHPGPQTLKEFRDALEAGR